MACHTFSKPDFIAIGPPKTGTTWIYKNLDLHPEVWMPPDKEIRYFWELAFIGDLNYKERQASSHWHHMSRQIFCHNRLRVHRENLWSLKLDFKTLWWDLKYTYGAHTDRWYSSLFDTNLVSGDISAKYCELPDEEIGRIRAHFPDLKIIITFRDPVEREWSRAKMNLCKRTGRSVDEVSGDEFIAEFNDPPQKRANDYVSLIRRWTHHFSESQVLVLFYDELMDDPLHYFDKLCRFLSISSPDETLKNQLTKVVFRGVAGDLPPDYERYLFDLHRDWMAGFLDFTDDKIYPAQWLKKHGGNR
ncbi:MAG: sulfotransferase [Deltaproteobacteria bacterium]|nr:sulfotransferase [Deltaproteobacteria bacterium]